jgi:hypothetical protein
MKLAFTQIDNASDHEAEVDFIRLQGAEAPLAVELHPHRCRVTEGEIHSATRLYHENGLTINVPCFSVFEERRLAPPRLPDDGCRVTTAAEEGVNESRYTIVNETAISEIKTRSSGKRGEAPAGYPVAGHGVVACPEGEGVAIVQLPIPAEISHDPNGIGEAYSAPKVKTDWKAREKTLPLVSGVEPVQKGPTC